jgi:hypothetical protein
MSYEALYYIEYAKSLWPLGLLLAALGACWIRLYPWRRK